MVYKKKEHQVNSNHTVNIAGCNKFVTSFNASLYPDFETCCEELIICYQTCKLSKEMCEISTKECFDRLCLAKSLPSLFSKIGIFYFFCFFVVVIRRLEFIYF